MPRFYFHTNDPAEGTVQDDEGMDFSSVQTAKCEAVAYAGRLLCDVAPCFWDDADFELTATDDQGLIVFTLRVVGTQAPAVWSASRPHQS